MQLGGAAPSGPAPRTVAEAITRGAATLGHRPAVTLLVPSGRQEQSGASLAQWAAKGAHLLELDLLIEPGDEVRIDAPLSWTTAAVALAVWWAGGVIRLDAAGDAQIAVIGAAGDPGAAEDVYVTGDRIDGAADVDVGREAWTLAAQPFPDQPPPSLAAPERPAIRHGAQELDQRAVLELAADHGSTGRLGVQVVAPQATAADPHAAATDGAAPHAAQTLAAETHAAQTLAAETHAADTQAMDVDAATTLVLVALRPLLSGGPTVILRGVDRAVAAGDRVERWTRTA
jgi:hypothetical protein